MIRFPFTIGPSFLKYDWHPITIPKAHYSQLEKEGPDEDRVSVISPHGETNGSIYSSRAGWGRFYQIRIFSDHRPDAISQFRLGQQIVVEIERKEGRVQITLR